MEIQPQRDRKLIWGLLFGNDISLLDPGNSMLMVVHDPGWSIDFLETGHWPMLSTPFELAAILDQVVQD